MTSANQIRKLDQNGLKVGQALSILLLLLAFILGESAWPLVAFVGVAQLLGGLGLPFAPYKLIYQYTLKAFIKPNIIMDNPEPHQFSMLLGAFFNGIASIALLLNRPLLAWILCPFLQRCAHQGAVNHARTFGNCVLAHDFWLAGLSTAKTVASA